MHFFGALGVLLFSLSFLGFALIAGNKVWAMTQGIHARNITELSEFYLALVGMVMGLQFFLTGFLAEMTSRTDSSRRDYQVSKQIGRTNLED